MLDTTFQSAVEVIIVYEKRLKHILYLVSYLYIYIYIYIYNFYTQYINIINKHFPIITSKVSSQIFSKNWITNNIKRKINKKQKLFNSYLQSKSELDLYVNLIEMIYKTQ